MYGCIDVSHLDPVISLPSHGCLLPPETFYLHRHDNKMQCSAQQNRVIEVNILVEANNGDDSVVTSRASHSEIGNQPVLTTEMGAGSNGELYSQLY